jgi:molybdopterin-synthase adenylyltransferase
MRTLENSVHIAPAMWQQIREAMLTGRTQHEETIGFLFCDRDQISKRHTRYLPKAWVVPTPDCYELQSESGLVLKQQFHHYLLENFLVNKQMDVVHLHTHHGTGFPSFSAVDDRAESEYAKFLSSRFNRRSRLISGVFDEFLQEGQFRIWNRRGTGFQPIACHRSWLPPQSIPVNSIPDMMFARQQVFGQINQQQLGQLSVALIGCGGIGAAFAETLGRLGVKNWFLVDPDRLETTNLNRMPAAHPEMVNQGWSKVQYLKHLLKQIHPNGSCIQAIPEPIQSVAHQIANADIIVVATDNHSSRQIAQEIALKHQRPLVCLGTHIEIAADRTPRLYARVTVPPLGGNWCLMCGNIINLHRAALETAPMPLSRLGFGYLEGIPDPSVYWLNSMCASTATGVIHGLVSGFLHLDNGLDWIFDFAQGNWLKTDVDRLSCNDCYFCH